MSKDQVFEDISVAYLAFLRTISGLGKEIGGLRYWYKGGLWTVTYDHGPSHKQIFALGASAGTALDALIAKARGYEKKRKPMIEMTTDEMTEALRPALVAASCLKQEERVQHKICLHCYRLFKIGHACCEARTIAEAAQSLAQEVERATSAPQETPVYRKLPEDKAKAFLDAIDRDFLVNKILEIHTALHLQTGFEQEWKVHQERLDAIDEILRPVFTPSDEEENFIERTILWGKIARLEQEKAALQDTVTRLSLDAAGV